MRIAGTIPNAVNAYDGVAYEIYIQGCTRNCKGCHSPGLQNYEDGTPLDIDEILQDIKKYEQWIDIISFLGGDPLCQDNNEFMRLVTCITAAFPTKRLWLFTGAEIDDVPLWCQFYFNVIKTGKFEEDLFQQGKFPASSNQKVLSRGVDYGAN